ncbi:MAG: winged helix-turn-helix domain-containing protein [Thermoproteota archaeon]|nr:winged helix-turn-helix domain-containing protein [Thermoproteota archaeon]
MLDAAATPLTKAKIMGRAVLSYEQLKHYLISVAKNELLGYDNNSRDLRLPIRVTSF